MPYGTDIIENALTKEHPQVLEQLLKDHSTGRNIFWATDSYEALGKGYQYGDEITVSKITGGHDDVIRPRALKSREEQARRVKGKGEVFTPAWLCREMNDFADAQLWAGLDKQAGWRTYVMKRCLELTCGEAPFLVSRYDSVSGEAILLKERVGLLDRKLRVVGEMAADGEYPLWALLAVGSVYGYEWQGDNLLLAREAVVATFSEYYKERTGAEPPEEVLLRAAEIVSWNLWQMDGLKAVVPGTCHSTMTTVYNDLFGEPERAVSPCQGCVSGDIRLHNGVRCQVRRWTAQDFDTFINDNIANTTNYITMKFDFVIGNPPYQEETNKGETNNGQRPSKSIFQYFQIAADKLSIIGSCLIYPGGRWIQRAGKGMKDFGLQQINDPHLEDLYYYPQSKILFGANADLTDGISIVCKKQDKTSDIFHYHYCTDLDHSHDVTVDIKDPGDKIIPLDPANTIIMDKVDEFAAKRSLKPLHYRVLPRSLFSIESDFVEKNPDKVRLYNGEPLKDDELKLLTNDKAGKAGRAKWYVASKSIIPTSAQKYVEEWQVTVSSANAGGQKRDNQIAIADNHSAFGRVRVALASFKTKQEAENFLAFCQTYIIRFAFLMTDEEAVS